jgi:hypothetical protein
MDFSIKRIPNPCARVSLGRDSSNTFHSGSHPYGSLFRLPVPPVCFGGATLSGCGSRLRISFMLIPPLQPCLACSQNSVRLFEDEEKIPLPSLLQQRDGCSEPLGDRHSSPRGTLSTGSVLSTRDRSTLENGFLGPALGSTGPIGEDKNFAGRHWRPGRFLLSFCTACGFARLSVRGRFVKNGYSTEGCARSNDGHRDGAKRILVLRRGEVAATHGEVDRRKGEGGSRRLCVTKGGLVQQSVSPTIPISGDLPRQEKYPSAEWTYFVGGVGVCREVFLEQLGRAYDVRRQSRVDFRL